MKRIFTILTFVILLGMIAVPVQAGSPVQPEPTPIVATGLPEQPEPAESASVASGKVLNLPLIRSERIRDWFRPEELDATMQDLGYDGDVWDMLIGCTLDETAQPEIGLIRYSSCTLYLTQIGGKYDILFYWSNQVQRVIWWYLEV